MNSNVSIRAMTGFAAGALALAVCAFGAAQAAPEAKPAAAAAAKPAPTPPERLASESVAAVVNDELITTYDVRQRMRLIIASTGIQPNEQNLVQIQEQALRGLVEEHLQLQEAKKYKVDISDKEVEAAVANIAAQNGSTLTDLTAEFAKSGISLDSLRQQLKADMAWRRIVSGRYGSRIRVSSDRVKETLARIEASASKPQYLVSEIYLYAEGPEEQKAALDAAGRLLEEMKKGAPFPVVARQFSSAPTAASGGDLGWMRSGELRPELESVVQNMQIGFVSEPIPVAGGVYIVALRDKRDGQTPIERVHLKSLQVAAADTDAVKSLGRVRDNLRDCDSMDGAAKRVNGATANDLGEITTADLADDMRARVDGLAPGQASNVFTADGVAQVLMVCSRRKEASGMPSADEIEARLYDQELSMVARRWLRDLRRDSTIITR
jgi:peptidyl-prolyl cis-trans isomerase SurA